MEKRGPYKKRYAVPAKQQGLMIWQLKPWSCRYIIDTPTRKETFYCGELVAQRSYCAIHAAICYRPFDEQDDDEN